MRLAEIAERKRAALPAAQVGALVPSTRDFGAAVATGRREPAVVVQLAGGAEKARLALELDEAEVPALCIAVDEAWGGTYELLAAVGREAGGPILMRDFVVAEAQLYLARALGADAVTLMPALLSDAELARLAGTAHSMHMAAVFEVRREAEARRALAAGARILLAEPLDLESGAQDLTLVSALSRLAPPRQVSLIASAPEATPAEVRALAGVADAALIAAAVTAAADPLDALRAFTGS